MSLAESVPAKMECHTPSKVVSQVEVGMQCSLALADKSVGCCFKAWSESRSVQTMETLEQLTSTSGFVPVIRQLPYCAFSQGVYNSDNMR
ncbi:uncharacterized protein LOC142590486 isoform X3 [Dermacentor variabilis]|uniref:uncharacterized protein LOC142590486 isoform X3 n=1 Tax=Dermacentor variabilis TaxID=34621 RepID=UPI003F5C3612